MSSNLISSSFPSSSSSSSGKSSFAADALARFAPHLELYEAHLASLHTEPLVEDDTVDRNHSLVHQSDAIDKAIRDVIDAVPMSSPSGAPDQAALLKLLDGLDRAYRISDVDPSQADSANATVVRSSAASESLRVAALARITYAAYALVLESLLNDAGKLNDQAWFWSQLEESTYRSLSFLVQTLPLRLTSLVRAALELAADNASQTVYGTLDRARKGDRLAATDGKTSLRNTLRTILATPDMVTGILFPYQWQSEGSITFAGVQQQAEEQQRLRDRTLGNNARDRHAVSSQSYDASSAQENQQRKKSRGTKAIRSAALRLSPVHMIRHEARCMRRGLIHERNLLAEKLGTLALQQTATDSQGSGKASFESMSSADVQKQFLQELGTKLGHLSAALNHSTDETENASEVGVNMDADQASIDGLTTSLRLLLHESLPRSSRRTQLILSPSRFGQPSHLTQNWPSLVFVPLALLTLSRYLSHNWDGIAAKLDEAKQTVRGFLIGWVWEPCVQLLDTVRHGNDEQASMIISRESLQSDLESLQRMVSSFTAEKYGVAGAELEAVAARVRQGDLTPVLRIYEDEIRSPLKSAVGGSLVRALLIQVQKAKVDLETAMSGIDKLLKSQQLLFGAVGIAPALGILYVSTSWIKSKLVGRSGLRSKKDAYAVRIRVWEALRRIDRLLSHPPSHPSSPAQQAQTHGLLLLDLSLLRTASYPLLLSAAKNNKHLAKRLHRQFLDDVRDLEEVPGSLPPAAAGGAAADSTDRSGGTLVQPGLGYWSRRAAVERMWRSWNGVVGIVA